MELICVKVKKACLLVQNLQYSSAAQPHSHKKTEAVVGSNRNRNVIYSSFILHCLQENVKRFPKLFRFFFQIQEHIAKRKVWSENRKAEARDAMCRKMRFSFLLILKMYYEIDAKIGKTVWFINDFANRNR